MSRVCDLIRKWSTRQSSAQEARRTRRRPYHRTFGITDHARGYRNVFGRDRSPVHGRHLDNNIALSRNAAGQILVNGGAVAVVGGTPTVANTSLIQISDRQATTRFR